MHDLIDQLKPIQGEVLIDKPGKGEFEPDYLSPRALLKFQSRSVLLYRVTSDSHQCRGFTFNYCWSDDRMLRDYDT
jgi:hypothetical protein